MEYGQLFAEADQNQEGTLTPSGALRVLTGKHTARSATAKFIVNDSTYPIAFNHLNKPLCPKIFDKYWLKASKHLHSISEKPTYQVGNHPTMNVHVRISTEKKWHQLFAHFLFLPKTSTPLETWSLQCCPSLSFTQHPTLIAISFKHKQVLICGTAYAGEIKKAMFSVLSTILPQHDTLPMHCSAVLSPQNETTLIFGLSGTGKTSLSADDSFTIIGDDEHGWNKDGVFNFEGGCYAKVAHLSKTSEPQIYHASKRPCILENVILDRHNTPVFDDISITENTRCAYPLSALPKTHMGVAPVPKNIIFLCCDLYGVIPTLSMLSPQQALEYFLIGYTAKVGSTEQQSTHAIQPISSPCFGQPFFPLPLSTYAALLKKRLYEQECNIWLMNTGWQNGSYPHGSRHPICLSKEIVHLIVHNKMLTKPHKILPELSLKYLTQLPSGQNLDYLDTWKRDSGFTTGLEKLLTLFDSLHTKSHFVDEFV